MIARVQMELVKLQQFNFEDMEFIADWSSTYVLIRSCIEQLPLVVTRCSFYTSNISEHL